MAAAALAGIGVAPARAHHGWSGFDTSRPLYLEGKVTKARWANPHAELEIELPPRLVKPVDLAQRTVPAQTAQVDGAALLSKADVPRRADRRWTVELAPLTRMEAWKVPEIREGETVAVVGFTLRDERGDAVVRAEYLFLGDRVYGLRSSPAA
ncbi:MAG TPA: DUF6152 family protein [Burkholderiaceae bacterium]|nr:DUF6152 family protein [Burkholderiaceae bacterium]